VCILSSLLIVGRTATVKDRHDRRRWQLESLRQLAQRFDLGSTRTGNPLEYGCTWNPTFACAFALHAHLSRLQTTLSTLSLFSLAVSRPRSLASSSSSAVRQLRLSVRRSLCLTSPRLLSSSPLLLCFSANCRCALCKSLRYIVFGLCKRGQCKQGQSGVRDSVPDVEKRARQRSFDRHASTTICRLNQKR
jgi:hypothetical protein